MENPSPLRRGLSALFFLGVGIAGSVAITQFGYREAQKSLVAPQPAEPASRYLDLRSDHRDITVSLGPNVQVGETLHCLAGGRLMLNVEVASTSPHVVESDFRPPQGERRGTNLSYRLFDRQNPEQQVHEGQRTVIAPPMRNADRLNRQVRVAPLAIHCPDQAKPVELRIEVVQEAIAWLSNVAPQDQYISVTLQPVDPARFDPTAWQSPWLAPEQVRTLTAKAPAAVRPQIAAAESIATAIVLLSSYLSVDRGRTSLLANAGSQYPMVWVRDMTMIADAQRLMATGVPDEPWFTPFWRYQRPDGQIVDWLRWSGGGREVEQDKNDVQSDQEWWLLAATAQAIHDRKVTLGGRVAGKSYRDRMHAALKWLERERLDPERGCFWSGHVIDWGDVGLSGRDSATSTKMSHGKPAVCGIFIQSLAFRTLEKVARLEKSFGRAKSLQQRVADFAQTLWQPKRGFFRIHEHLEEWPHSHPEEAQFAMGGNVLAILSGLATAKQGDTIRKTLVDKQKEYGVSTVGAAILPPYPSGTYANPIQSEPYTYQNGGQWDWWAGRAIEALALRDVDLAWHKLAEVATQAVAAKSFYEWYHRDGSPGHGRHFRAGAAAYLRALARLAGRSRHASGIKAADGAGTKTQ